MNDYTKRGEVMNPPESAAQGSEAGNLNTPHCDGTGAVPADRSKGTEAQATQPSAAPCQCPTGVCRPEDNEGARCWRSGCYIPMGYFSRPCPAPINGKTTAAECIKAGQCGCDEREISANSIERDHA